MKQQARMNKLRALLKEQQTCKQVLDQLIEQTKQAQKAYDKASTAFRSYQDDIIGDLFNGCFGKEWLLVDLEESNV